MPFRVYGAGFRKFRGLQWFTTPLLEEPFKLEEPGRSEPAVMSFADTCTIGADAKSVGAPNLQGRRMVDSSSTAG